MENPNYNKEKYIKAHELSNYGFYVKTESNSQYFSFEQTDEILAYLKTLCLK